MIGPVHVEYSGEWFVVDPGSSFTIGRTADLSMDDNPYLHRTFLELRSEGDVWLLTNIGSQLGATVSDEGGHFTAYLAAGAVLPLVFERTVVRFGAGATTYELCVVLLAPPFSQVSRSGEGAGGSDGTTTRAPVNLSPSQRRLVLALAEPSLRNVGTGPRELPTTADAAARLGWTKKRFHKALDAVCRRLADAGVNGLHGAPGDLAANRRARLVDYCISTGLVRIADLDELERSS